MKLNEMENIGMAAAETMMIICATVINSVEISSIFFFFFQFERDGLIESQSEKATTTKFITITDHNSCSLAHRCEAHRSHYRQIGRTLAHSQLNAAPIHQ